MNVKAYIAVAAVVLLLGCRQAQPSGAISEPFSPDEGSVPFTATLVSTAPDGTQLWDGTYLADKQTAHFKFELGTSQSIDAKQKLGFGNGRFIAVEDSQPGSMLLALQKALEAKHFPKKSTRSKELRFQYADLGSGFSMLQRGGFTDNPPGNWRTTKLFLGTVGDDDDIEVFFNLNPILKKGEFSIKDVDYGDHVLIQLAKVL